MEEQCEFSESQIKQEVTDEGRMKAELLSVRSEYSETYLQLQNEKKLTNSLKSDKSAFAYRIKDMGEKMISFEKEKNDLLQKLKNAGAKISSLANEKHGLSQEMKHAQKTIKALNAEKAILLDKSNSQKREINVLEARMKQLQFGAQQNAVYNLQPKKKTHTKDETSDESEFEVQKLVDHKVMEKKRHFLVHWRGYDSGEDSWVPESQLNCPKILKSYLKSKNMV